MLISALCKVKKSVKISTLRADTIPMENKFQMISDKSWKIKIMREGSQHVFKVEAQGDPV